MKPDQTFPGRPECSDRFGVLTPTDLVVLTDAATVTWDTAGNAAPLAKVTLAGNRTLVIANAVAGQRGRLEVFQDATGSRTLTLPAGSIREGGALALTATAGARDLLSYEFDGSNFWWSIRKAFA
jgi:hypothetical protein